MPLTDRRRRRRQPRSSPIRFTATALIALSLGASYVVANTGSLPLRSTSKHGLDNELSAASDTTPFHQDKRLSASSEQSNPDPLNRRKHVTFQDLDQLQGTSGLDRSRSRVLTLDKLNPKSPAALHYQDAPTNDLDAAMHQPDSSDADSFVRDSRLLVAPPSRQNQAQKPASGRSRVAYNQDLVGKQTGNGYVFSRHPEPDLTISNAGAALVNLFSRRDSPVSRPPLVPNSNSRLLIILVFVCIIGVGILTLAAQHMWRRLQAAIQPRSPLRRRSGEGRSTRTLHRSDGSYTSLHGSSLSAPSFDEEEERIKTPPTLSRRSSAAAAAAASSAASSSSATTPHNEMGSDSDDDESERKTSHDLHYLALPFGIGIGYSYATIADGGDARSRISRLAAKRSRRRSGSSVALSTGALPIAGTSAVSGADGLRSRTRSFKELCRDAFGATTSRDIGMISEEEAEADMTTVPTTRWGSSLISLDLSGSERGSGTVTPTGPSAASLLPTTVASSIALEDLASTQTSKGRFFGVEGASAAAAGHTLIDLGLGTPDVAVSNPDGITRPASTPGVMPSQVARHPQVEHLRREGRSETGKRVGKGTPTNAKLH
ncbi:uncharacterized protein SRS1_13316 [Sporisorium reilianum f. sp. reilianum]|uniref:Uncharacterized protein n=1 Tax=Sporisorium reilianum f. sp. reilianum TaxID=72559 RepID=A0A2N8UBS6_9BASI|nr:uncharacterized protein SRS1_13316 [Sporisorium reilianum f. sp. reilianum]